MLFVVRRPNALFKFLAIVLIMAPAFASATEQHERSAVSRQVHQYDIQPNSNTQLRLSSADRVEEVLTRNGIPAWATSGVQLLSTGMQVSEDGRSQVKLGVSPSRVVVTLTKRW